MFLCSFGTSAQFFQRSDTLNPVRLGVTTGLEVVGHGSSMFLLNYLWYQYYDRSDFHAFDDNAEWLQMDKAGHAMTSYYIGEFGYDVLRWTGLDKKRSLWFGGTLGSAYLLTMEVLDGFSQEWGFSWGDIAANTAGTALFMFQEGQWDEQRFRLKVSAHLSPYYTYRPELLGYNTHERLLKDYNGQTYWLSGNISSFLKPETRFPKWLNVAVGYGGEEMVSGRPEDDLIYQGTFSRYRQLYLAPDIDFTRIPVKKKWLKPFLFALNLFKFPAPALELNRHGLHAHWVYF